MPRVRAFFLVGLLWIPFQSPTFAETSNVNGVEATRNEQQTLVAPGILRETVEAKGLSHELP